MVSRNTPTRASENETKKLFWIITDMLGNPDHQPQLTQECNWCNASDCFHCPWTAHQKVWKRFEEKVNTIISNT